MKNLASWLIPAENWVKTWRDNYRKKSRGFQGSRPDIQFPEDIGHPQGLNGNQGLHGFARQSLQIFPEIGLFKPF
jgi:hypothetical protein